jgi:predicted phage terminase large subunit-like protein
MEEIDLPLLMRSNFQAHLEKVCNILNPDKPFKPNWHHRAIAWRLEQVAAGQITRLAICLPPRHLKSTIASVAFPTWLLGRNPTTKIICGSYGEDLAGIFSKHSRTVMTHESFRKAFPELKFNKMAENHLNTDKGGYRFATTRGGTLPGLGADFIIIDDPIKYQDANSEVHREAVNDWMRTLSTRFDDSEKGAIVLVMHRVHEDDAVAWALEKGGWTILNLPAQALQDEHTPYGPDLTHVRKAGEFLHPEHFGPGAAAKIKNELGTNWYEALYNQNPLPPGSNHFDVDMFKRYDKPPICDYIMFSVDVATTSGGGDYSVCTIWGYVENTFYLLDVWRKQVSIPELKATLHVLDKKWNPHLIAVESVGSGTALAQVLKEELGRHVMPYGASTSKDRRFAAAALMIGNGRVAIPYSAAWLETYLKELLSFPNGKYDDQVDSTSQLLNGNRNALMFAKQGRNPRAKPANVAGYGGSVQLYRYGSMPDLW